MNKVFIIGIGFKPLEARARRILADCGEILVSARLHEPFRSYKEYEWARDKLRIINTIDQTLAYLRSRLVGGSNPVAFAAGEADHKSGAIVLLASGDPLLFGIGSRAVRELGEEAVEIIPDLSCIQLAFARIKKPWDEALLISVHGGPGPENRGGRKYGIEDIPALLVRHPLIAILTDREHNPAAIARTLNPETCMYVCERLGYPDEKISTEKAGKLAMRRFADPNLVIVQRADTKDPLPEYRFGLAESDITHSEGLITKDEVRAVTIHKLRLPGQGVLWDVGAGSGSVSLESARLFPGLKVMAIERDQARVKRIKANTIRFGAENIKIIQGEAPRVLQELPDPQRVFIGGSGGRLKEIIVLVCKRVKSGAILVVNAATLEALHASRAELAAAGFSVDVSQLSVARSRQIGGKTGFKGLNPVFIIRGIKD